MAVIGMFLVGLGILLLNLCVSFLFLATRADDPVPIIVIGLLCMPITAIGIAIIRRAEDRTVRKKRRFDLNRLNWIGWLLFLTTVVFFAVGTVLVTFLQIKVAWVRHCGLVVLTFCFFAGLRLLLGVFGISIYRW